MTKATIQLGADAIKQVYERALGSRQVDSICLSSNYDAILGNWFDEVFASKLYDGSRGVREVLPEAPENRAAAKTKPARCEARFVGGPRSETDLIVTDSWAALISYNPESAGVLLIEDPEAVTLHHRLFEASWETAQK